MEHNIFLIGFMGSGKSTIARALNRQFGMRLIEMDEQIEAQEKMSITEIFRVHGEGYFRTLETRLLEELEGETGTVVSCGGGVPMRECNVDAMRRSGKIVYLSAGPETIYERVRHHHNRPLLEENMNIEYIAELMEARLPAYLAAADVTVETDGRAAADICREIADICGGIQCFT